MSLPWTHLEAGMRYVPLPPSCCFRSGALVVHAEEKQCLRPYDWHLGILADGRSQQHQPFDLRVFRCEAQSLPSRLGPARYADDAGLPLSQELHVSPRRLVRIGVAWGQQDDATAHSVWKRYGSGSLGAARTTGKSRA